MKMAFTQVFGRIYSWASHGFGLGTQNTWEGNFLIWAIKDMSGPKGYRVFIYSTSPSEIPRA